MAPPVRFLPLTSLDGAFFEKFPLFSNFLRKLLPDPGRPSGGRCTAACNKGLPPRGKAPAGGCGARRPGAPSPWVGAACGRPGWQGATLRGPDALRGCGSPPQGQGPFLFLRKKKRALTPKKKKGRSTVGVWSSTAACVFTHCGEDQPRPLRPSQRGTGMVFGSILRPPGASTLRAEVVRCLACGGGGRACVRRAGGVAPHKGGELHAARGLLPHSAARVAPAGGGWLERRPVPVPQGQAVTAGRGPLCHTKAAGRRG